MIRNAGFALPDAGYRSSATVPRMKVSGTADALLNAYAANLGMALWKNRRKGTGVEENENDYSRK